MGTDSMALKAPPRQPALWCTKGGSRTGFPPCSLRMAHGGRAPRWERSTRDRKSTRLNSSHSQISYAVFCLKKKKKKQTDVYVKPAQYSHSAYTNSHQQTTTIAV